MNKRTKSVPTTTVFGAKLKKRKIFFSRVRFPSHILRTLGTNYFLESTKLNYGCVFLFYFRIVDQRNQFTKQSPSSTPKMNHFSVKIHTDLSFFPSNIKIFGKCTKRLKVRKRNDSKEISFSQISIHCSCITLYSRSRLT